jgi:hypothetical protein
LLALERQARIKGSMVVAGWMTEQEISHRILILKELGGCLERKALSKILLFLPHKPINSIQIQQENSTGKTCSRVRALRGRQMETLVVLSKMNHHLRELLLSTMMAET